MSPTEFEDSMPRRRSILSGCKDIEQLAAPPAAPRFDEPPWYEKEEEEDSRSEVSDVGERPAGCE